jgi:hypothetical protein
MKTRAFVSAVAAMAGLALSANAQVTSQGSVSVSLSFIEVDAVTGVPVGSPNGVIDPNEAAQLSMNVSFTGFNTVASFSPSIGTFTTGTIRGFGSAILDLNGTANNGGNANGSWSTDINVGLGLQAPFDAAGEPGFGTPTGGGSHLINVQPGQFPSGASGIATTNPAFVWTGIWTPGSYASRTVTFATAPGSVVNPGSPFAALMLRLNASLAGSASIGLQQFTHGSVNIPVAPAPASLALLGLGAMVAGRRRR